MMISNEEIIQAILTTATKRSAAKKLGISERTLHTRLQDAQLKRQIDEARAEMLEDAVGTLQQGIGAATSCMLKIIYDENAPASVRLNAADAVMRNSIRLTEQLELRKRLQDLESAYQILKGKSE